MARFELTSSTFFLTYSKALNIDKDDIINTITEKANEKDVSVLGYIIAKEHHRDGTQHYHILFKYSEAIRIRTKAFFDCEGYHPSIERPRSEYDSFIYCIKEDDDFWCMGCYSEPPPKVDKPSKTSQEDAWHQILQESSDTNTFLNKVLEKDPRSYFLYLPQLRANAEEHFKDSAKEAYKPRFTNFRVPEPLANYLELEFNKIDRPKTLVLVGPSRIGKTAWARSLGHHMYFNHMFNLDDWDDTATYMVLDDIEFEFIPARKALFFGQEQFVMTDKYRKKKTVRWGKPVLYLCNNEPQWDKYKDPYQANIFIVHIVDTLF